MAPIVIASVAHWLIPLPHWPIAPLPHSQQAPVFRALAEVVQVPVAVTNGGRVVEGLTTSDFEVLDNGVLQSIESSSLEALPIDVTVLADVSGSVDGPVRERFVAQIQAIAASLPAEDRVRLITFGAAVRDVTGWQSGGTALALDHVEGGGGTSLYDALAGALLATTVSDRPHVIVAFSDGLDNSSLFDASGLEALAGLTPATMYLSLARAAERPLRGVAPWSGQPDVRLLRGIVERTGGELTERQSASALEQPFAEALARFRTMYLLRYTPTGVARGGWHTLTVRIPGRRYEVRARPGYEGG
jgi:VWFA-related protein